MVPVDKARWETFLPLHELWRAYVAGLLQGGSSGGTAGGEREAKGEREAERRLGSAELVGAAVTVSACERPSLCGTRGIVARDSARCVVLVTRGDELVTVPKKGARFEVEAEAGSRGGSFESRWTAIRWCDRDGAGGGYQAVDSCLGMVMITPRSKHRPKLFAHQSPRRFAQN